MPASGSSHCSCHPAPALPVWPSCRLRAGAASLPLVLRSLLVRAAGVLLPVTVLALSTQSCTMPVTAVWGRAAWAQETAPTVQRAGQGDTADALHGTPGGAHLTLPRQVCATPRGLRCARATEVPECHYQPLEYVSHLDTLLKYIFLIWKSRFCYPPPLQAQNC